MKFHSTPYPSTWSALFERAGIDPEKTGMKRTKLLYLFIEFDRAGIRQRIQQTMQAFAERREKSSR
jgi:hypothetical protein